jgi:hypothetical protein
MRFKFLLVVGLLALSGCPKTVDREAPGPSPIKPPDTDLCGKMCAKIGPKGLKCEEGASVYDSDKPGPPDVPNTTCEDFCRTTQDRGAFLNPKCVALVKSCAEIEPARKKKPETCTE